MDLLTRDRPELIDREALVRAHTPLVKSIAARYVTSGEPFEDLVQEGYVGLLSAIDLFEPDQKIQFSTYAYYLISGQIRHYLRDRGTLIRQPAWIQELRSKVDRASASLADRLGREPTLQEIAAETGMTEDKVQEVQATGRMSHVLRLQPSEGEEEGGTIDPERIAADPASRELSVEQRMVLDEALAKLKQVEQRVVDAFFFRGMTQAEIARQLRVSHNYVSRVLRNSTRRLQSLLDDGALSGDPGAGLGLLLGGAPRRGYGGVTDPDTGLYNADYCLERLDEELLRAQRYGYPLAVLAAVVRDGEGLAHDRELLRLVGELVREGFRRIDISARAGESCFLVLMPHTGQTASVAGDRLQRTVEAQEPLRARGVRVTTGVAVYPEQTSTVLELVRLALERSLEGLDLDPLDLVPSLQR